MNATRQAVSPVTATPAPAKLAFEILAPDPACVDREYLAHAMAYQPLYNGRLACFYPLAQHAISVATLLPMHLRMAGLLYRSPMAYMGDFDLLRTPFPGLQKAEDAVRAAIYAHFGVPSPSEEDLALIRAATLAVSAAERRDLLHESLDDLPPGSEISPALVHPHPPLRVKQSFLSFLNCLRMNDLFE